MPDRYAFDEYHRIDLMYHLCGWILSEHAWFDHLRTVRSGSVPTESRSRLMLGVSRWYGVILVGPNGMSNLSRWYVQSTDRRRRCAVVYRLRSGHLQSSAGPRRVSQLSGRFIRSQSGSHFVSVVSSGLLHRRSWCIRLQSMSGRYSLAVEWYRHHLSAVWYRYLQSESRSDCVSQLSGGSESTGDRSAIVRAMSAGSKSAGRRTRCLCAVRRRSKSDRSGPIVVFELSAGPVCRHSLVVRHDWCRCVSTVCRRLLRRHERTSSMSSMSGRYRAAESGSNRLQALYAGSILVVDEWQHGMCRCTDRLVRTG